MLVSGAPLFLGGGNSDPRVCGRCADSVINGLLDEAGRGEEEEKGARRGRRQRAHVRGATGCAEKRKMDDSEGAAVRRVAIFVAEENAAVGGNAFLVGW